MPVSDVRCAILILALLVAASWALMEAPSAQEPAPAAEAGPPADAIREAQALLAALGYATGPADAGTWSDGLSRAYRAFLRDAGLPASETLTPRGLRRLREVARSEGVAAGTPAPMDTAPNAASDPLHRAVVAGDIDGAQALLSGGAAVDGRDGQGWTPLMHAAHKGYVLLVEVLLQAGASPDIRAPDGATALFIAVMNGHPEAIALLMRAGASVSIRGPRGLSAADAARLIYGDNEGQRPVPDDAEVHALLGGMTWEEAVKAAVAERRVETDPAAIEASLGLDRKARVQAQRRLSTLGFAPGPADGVFGRRTRLAISNWQQAEGLSETGYLTRAQADTLIARQAVQGHGATEEAERKARPLTAQSEKFRELLGRPPSVDAKEDSVGWTDLHYAALLDLPAVVESLIGGGMATEVQLQGGHSTFGDDLWRTLKALGRDGFEVFEVWGGETPLMIAAHANARATADALIARGADINARGDGGDTPLHVAVRKNSPKMAELLIERGAEVDVREPHFDYTPLHLAVRENSPKMAELLIEAGADINARDDDGETPLHEAARKNSPKMAELLIERGAEVDVRERHGGYTPLHMAVWENSPQMAGLLIERGADINARDDDGETPLHEAARKNSPKMAELLIERGAEVDVRDPRSYTPLHLAVRNCRGREIVELLIARGADINAKTFSGRTPLEESARKYEEDRDDCVVVQLLRRLGATMR